MYRLNEVVHHWIYQDYYGRIKRLEKERIFCCHQMTHLLDVARIAYIKNLEIISYKPSNGIDDNFYIYEKESLIPTFIPQDIILIKRKGGKVQIWYGGRLSKFPEWFQINIDAAYEEKKCHPSTDISSYIENTLSREGFLKLN